MIKTLEQIKIEDSYNEFTYQEKLTKRLDLIDSDFDQSVINEIVLWKVNRYAQIPKETIVLLNKISKTDTNINIELTTIILEKLLDTKGIRLPMASTILRFKNPKTYQTIDQRVYRVITGENYSSTYSKSKKAIDKQIKSYFEYLDLLYQKCKEFKIPFEKSDRILFMADKDVNKNIPIKY